MSAATSAVLELAVAMLSGMSAASRPAGSATATPNLRTAAGTRAATVNYNSDWTSTTNKLSSACATAA